MTLLTPTDGKGLELYNYIRDALGITKPLVALDIRFRVDEPITYTATAYAGEITEAV